MGLIQLEICMTIAGQDRTIGFVPFVVHNISRWQLLRASEARETDPTKFSLGGMHALTKRVNNDLVDGQQSKTS